MRFTASASAVVASDRERERERVIEQSGLDMDHVTERRGSPYTLVCTKTRKSFRARLEQYDGDVRYLRRLATLGDVEGLDEKQARRTWERANEAARRGRGG